MKLEKATQKHLQRLSKEFLSVQDLHRWGGTTLGFPTTPSKLHKDIDFKNMASFVLKEKNNILGFGQIRPQEGHIHLCRLYIFPMFRQKGYAKILIQKLIQKGVESFALTKVSLNVYEDNLIAKSCYEKLGFKKKEKLSCDQYESNCIFMVLEKANL